jgi:hypothetical protein
MSRVTEHELPQEYRKRTLDEHVSLSARKPVSYLPRSTIEKVLGLTVDDYRKLVERAGNKCVVFSENQTCIQSGAVFAYRNANLASVLDHYSDLLIACDWPRSPEAFVRRVAFEWCEEKAPVMPIIQAAFGEKKSIVG